MHATGQDDRHLDGWTSPRIAEAFGVRDDTVRLWRSDFADGVVEALTASVAPGPAPVKSETALRVVTPLLEEPVADRRNWTIPRLRAEIEAREGVRISRSQLSKALRKKVPLAAAATHAEGTPGRWRGRTDRAAPAIAQTAGRSRRHRPAPWRREPGVDASPSRPRIGKGRSGPARASTRTGQEGRDAGLARSRHAPTHRPHQPDQAQQVFRSVIAASSPTREVAGQARHWPLPRPGSGQRQVAVWPGRRSPRRSP